MKKQYTVIALALSATLVLTGCSWSDIRAKFVGQNGTASSVTVSEDGSVVIEDYDANKVLTLADYKGVEVDVSVTDEEIQEEIDSLLDANKETEEIKKGKAKNGYVVNIDFVGKIDGKEFDGGSGEGQSLTLGEGQFIEDLENGIVGMKVGETKDIDVTFPDPYAANQELSGKAAVFTVTLNSMSKEKTPEFTDAFVKKKTSYKSIKEYKSATKKDLIEQKKSNAASTALQTVMDNSTVNEMPESLKEAQKKQMDHYYRYSITSYYGEDADFDTILGGMGMTKEQYETQLDSSAESSAKIILVVEAIADKENITVDETELQEYLDTTVSQAGASMDEYKSQYETYYGEAIPFDSFTRTSFLYDKVLEFMQDTLVLKGE